MGNIQKSTNSLIPSTNRDQVVTDNKKAFKRALKVFSSIGGDVNEVTTHIIRKSIEEHEITISQLEHAFMRAYENAKYKVKWADVLPYAKTRTPTSVMHKKGMEQSE